MRKVFQLITNYYLVLKNCWFVLLFIAIGYFAFCRFDQGLDILVTLGFTGEGPTLRHTIFAYLAISWWSWQSFRAARTILHFSHFNFWSYRPTYSIRAQVFVPRFLATLPYLVFAKGLYIAHGEATPLFYVMMSSAMWMFVFLHFRKALIVWIRARRPHWGRLIPDYIPIKNASYPARFIWEKQHTWVWFRLLVVATLFVIVYLRPIDFPRYVGSAAIVLLAFGSWLIVASILTFVEKYLRFPISFTVVICLFVFSFFNNNHDVRLMYREVDERQSIDEHFGEWIQPRLNGKDTTTVYLIMAEGGGIRSAFWTTGVYNRIIAQKPDLQANTYALSGVSGGALSSALITSTAQTQVEKQWSVAQSVLKRDYLAPVTGALTFQDMVQRFLPFPVKSFDRMTVLEKSWEIAWNEANTDETEIGWDKGVVEQFGNSNFPLMILNSTHVESGHRALISNVNLNNLDLDNIKDLVKEVQADIPVSTAVGMSSRFPFLTPPARLKLKDGTTWGSLVDGGYYENLGVGTMMDVYDYLVEICDRQNFPVRFHFIAIRNTKISQSEVPINGMFEILSPLNTFSNIWENTGDLALQRAALRISLRNDLLTEIHLRREDTENIPLGWYLSDDARASINKQLSEIVFK